MSRVVSGLGSFGAAVAAEGLDGALRGLGLAVLQGRPAAEVVARIAEHISEGVDGMQGEILATALREAIFEAATLQGDLNYENLDKSLQDFLSRDGAEGLVELFLTHYVFERVWSIIESHVDRKSNTDADAEALASAVESACRSHVTGMIDERKRAGDFDTLDWFGRDGQQFGEEIVSDLEARLSALA